MAYVGFKLGTQAALDTMYTNKTATEGIFYLTNDTNRLYIGKTGGEVAAVNEGVITVDAIANLPTGSNRITGSFYYATAENVLCVFNGSSWVQINAIVTNKSMGTVLTDTSGTVAVKTTITDSQNKTLNTQYTVTGANGITVSSSETAMTITGDPISVTTAAGSANDATVTIASDSGATNGSFGVKGGENVTVTASENVITVVAKDTKTKSVSTSNHATSGFNIIVTDSDNVSKNGQLDPIIKIGKTKSEVKFVNGAADLNVYTISETDGLISKVNSDFEAALRGFNAMEYQGTVGSSTADAGVNLPTANVKSGYSYLVTGDSFVGADGKSYPAGTLIVAYGNENDSGFLDPIKWSYVTGSVTDTQYTGSAISGGMTLTQKNNNAVVMSLKAQSAVDNASGVGSDIVITSSATSGTSQILSFAHKKYSDSVSGTDDAAQPDTMQAVSTYDIPVISGITVQNGHITGYTTKTYKVVDTNSSLSIATTVSADTGKTTGTVAQAFTLTNGKNQGAVSNSNFTINSSTLEVTANTGKTGLEMNLVWGSF